jgi:hypothetical protein
MENGVYEVVRVQVLLSKQAEFRQLHREVLMPACREIGITVEKCLMAQVGPVGEVVDVYSYLSYEDYCNKTSALEKLLIESGYYPQVQSCINGTINVSLCESLC